MLVELSELGDHLPDFLLGHGELVATTNEAQGKVDHDIVPADDKRFLEAECGLIMSGFALVLLDESQVQVVTCPIILCHISNVDLKMLFRRVMKT